MYVCVRATQKCAMITFDPVPREVQGIITGKTIFYVILCPLIKLTNKIDDCAPVSAKNLVQTSTLSKY